MNARDSKWRKSAWRTYLTNSGHAGNHKFAVRVVLQRGLVEEEVHLVVVSLAVVLALWHLGHGDEVGLCGGRPEEETQMG